MIWSALVSFALWLLGKITGKGPSTEERLGAEEAANAQLRAGQDAIRRADEAAKKIERNPPARDSNDLDG